MLKISYTIVIFDSKFSKIVVPKAEKLSTSTKVDLQSSYGKIKE